MFKMLDQVEAVQHLYLERLKYERANRMLDVHCPQQRNRIRRYGLAPAIFIRTQQQYSSTVVQ